MQDRYVGDIGDFGKYALLQALFGPADGSSGRTLSLGIVWYLMPDEESSGDGSLLRYLEPTPGNLALYRDCDPILYDTLGSLVSTSNRSVAALRESGVLPPGTVSYEEPLSFAGIRGNGRITARDRLTHRALWVRNAVDATERCEVVFADPDNGLEVAGVPRHHRRGPKYVCWDELEPYAKRGQSVIVYQHTNHRVPAETQIKERLAQLSRRLRPAHDPFALVYHRGSSRAYLIAAARDHQQILLDRAKKFLEGPWGRHRHFTRLARTPGGTSCSRSA